MLKGFFFPNRDRKKEKANHLPKSKAAGGCEACGLDKSCKSPRMAPTGEGRLGVMIIPEAPGGTEDEQGTQLVGEAGQLLRKKLSAFGLDLDRDFWKSNVLSCRPPLNREPSKKELKCCQPRVLEAIEKYKPRMIWLMGNPSLESFYMGKGFEDLSVGLWKNHCVPDRETGMWIVPLYHPSYALRSRGSKIIESIFDRDLDQAISWLDRKSPRFHDFEKDIVLVKDFNDLTILLRSIDNGSVLVGSDLVFDYETTGLRPYRPGHKIASCSVYWEGSAYSFPYQYPGIWTESQFAKIEALWRKVLTNPRIKKVGQNIKFEDKWSRNIVGARPEGWKRDTMLTSHLLDERSGASGLKIQAYWRWGVWGYDQKVKSLLEGEPFNRVMEIPLDDLLLYGGMDSRLEYELDKEQQSELSLTSNRSIRQAVKLYFEGTLALCEMEEFGIHVDEKYFEKQKGELQTIIDRLEKRVSASAEVMKFKDQIGRLPDLNSNTDLGILLYKVLGLKAGKTTVKGNASVDEEALDALSAQVSFVRSLVQKRKYEKTRNTYIAQFMREAVNGVVYPNTNLQAARTGRPSTDSPNMKNIPKRNEEAKKIVRSGIIPSPGHKIMETDYSGAEVRAAACLTKDPTLVGYINDKATDMHRDQAVELFMLSPEQMLPKKGNKEWNDNVGKIRFVAKNGWTFAQFYGSWHVPCAMGIWDEVPKLKLGDGAPMADHLAEKGIRRIDTFTEHLRGSEDKLWNRFPVFRDWQDEQVEFYCRRGYVENPFGFRRSGLNRRNQIINTPIQGTAYHWMLWSQARIMEIWKAEGWKTKVPGEIYDALWTDLWPPEGKHVREVYTKVMTRDIRRAFDWIIVPLEVEHEEANVGEPWYCIRKREED